MGMFMFCWPCCYIYIMVIDIHILFFLVITQIYKNCNTWSIYFYWFTAINIITCVLIACSTYQIHRFHRHIYKNSISIMRGVVLLVATRYFNIIIYISIVLYELIGMIVKHDIGYCSSTYNLLCCFNFFLLFLKICISFPELIQKFPIFMM